MAVNGSVVTKLGTKADAERDIITVDGIRARLGGKKYYILLNKPVGYTSTRYDPHAKHTVIELVSDVDAFLYPVGRLDVDTSGLILLANDGDFAHLLTHPSHEIDKTYVATVTGRVGARVLKQLQSGVRLEDGETHPASARLISYSATDNMSTVEITIHEGRKRQVRRMFEKLGHRVIRLRRTKLAFLDLSGVSEGHYRHLTGEEIARLRKLALRSTE